MPYARTTQCMSAVICTLALLVQPTQLSAHDTDVFQQQTLDHDGNASHLEIDVAPTLEEERELVERVERERLGINPNTSLAARMSTDPGQVGRWGSVQNWPVIGVFTSVMPDGRVLVFDSINDQPTEASASHTFTRAMIWTPANGDIERIDVDTGWNIFCAGFATLPDGRTFIAGGNRDSSLNGIEQTHTFNHLSDTWARGQRMDFARWYPSVTPLSSGEMLITGGGFATSEVREVDGQIRQLTNANASVWDNRDYPWLQTAPDGRVLFLGPSRQLGFVSTDGSGSWQATSTRDNQFRSYGSYAMFDDDRVLVAGGGFQSSSFSQRSARIINMNDSSSSSTGNMVHRRRQHNLTVLPDGTVLATGGFASNSGLVDLNNSVFAAEVWNPATGQWTELAEEERARQYHSTATLLPDGRVLSAGGGICGACQQAGYIQKNAQVYSPPYLFNKDGSGTLASRPQIQSAPSEVRYNQLININSSQASSIAKVAMIRTSSVTHAQNMEQRYLPLDFSFNGSTLNVRMPANANVAPPGHYMLFIVDNNGVPSVAPIIRISDSTQDPAPVINATNHALNGTASASSNSGNAALAIDGVTDGNFANGSVYSSSQQNQPWWEIDLGDSRDIEQIALHRRTDCCGNLFSGIHVLVSDQRLPDNLSDALATEGISEFYVESFFGSEKRIDIDLSARYVRIQLASNTQLELAEVQIFDDSNTGGNDECGNPGVNPSTEGGVFIWKSCNGVWSLLLSGESGLGTVEARGEIKSSLGFINVEDVSVESTDTLIENGDDSIIFDFKTANPWTDQFDFIVANNDELCVRLDNVTKNQSVFVGPNRVPAPSGSFNPVTLQACGSTCLVPTIDRNNDVTLTTWVDCSGRLHLYATAGTTSARYTGRVTNDGVFSDITTNSVETTDSVVSVSDSEVFFELTTGASWYDEVVLTGSNNYCVAVDSLSSGATVVAGPNRQIMNGPFNPLTLQACETSTGECGDPGVDPGNDAGFFVWKRCDGNYRVMITGENDGLTAKYVGRITSSTGFTSVSPISIESSDSLTTQGNEISFDLRTSYPWQDQIAFTADDNANLCLTLLSQPTGSQAFVGPDRVATVATSFDPRTGGACQ